MARRHIHDHHGDDIRVLARRRRFDSADEIWAGSEQSWPYSNTIPVGETGACISSVMNFALDVPFSWRCCALTGTPEDENLPTWRWLPHNEPEGRSALQSWRRRVLTRRAPDPSGSPGQRCVVLDKSVLNLARTFGRARALRMPANSFGARLPVFTSLLVRSKMPPC